ncbi:hypothetical protein HHI36_003343 [Cryptolaemus montrouzieri]|uniref:Uncharacterized protein n=1 Tax=Cryptolaemus montrouzieri TaxID=559131 RepID=A0ABD2PD51_9CUCU
MKQTAWWSIEIRAEIKKKKSYWQGYHNEVTVMKWKMYKEQRKKVKYLILKAKQKTWQEFGNKLENDSEEKTTGKGNRRGNYGERTNRGIKNLKIGKAPEEDKITTEINKTIEDEEVELLLIIVNEVGKEKRIRDDWRVGSIVPIYMKFPTDVNEKLSYRRV